MKTKTRHLRRRLAAGAAAGLLAAAAGAQERLSPDVMGTYGGDYSVDCADPAAPRLRVAADTLMVEQGGKRMTARNPMASFSAYGQSPPPGFQVQLMGEVRRGLSIYFNVYEQRRTGRYVTLDGDTAVVGALGKALVASRFRPCGGAARAEPAPPPAARARPQGAPPAADANLYTLLADPAFASAFRRALGPRHPPPWVASLEGPSPANRPVRIAGQPYLLAAVCKPHDCADHNLTLLYSAGQGLLYGLLFEAGRTTLLGAPSPLMAGELDRLWRAEWRSGR